MDVQRAGQVLSIGTGSVRVYLGCTGFPLFQILVKLMIAEWVVFRKIHISWRTQTLIAAGVAMVVGIMRLATLAVVAANRTSFHFWHGEGSKLFTAIAVVVLFPSSACGTVMAQGHSIKKPERSYEWIVVALALVFAIGAACAVFFPFCTETRVTAWIRHQIPFGRSLQLPEPSWLVKACQAGRTEGSLWSAEGMLGGKPQIQARLTMYPNVSAPDTQQWTWWRPACRKPEAIER